MYVCDIDFWRKWNVSGSVSGKSFACCAFTVRYSTYNTVGQSIASISDLGGIFTSGLILATVLPTVLYIYIYIYIYI